jgi:tellurite methyltransferase
METLKPWDWKQVTGEHRRHWQTPAMEVFHFANLLRKEGKTRVYDLGCGLGRNILFLIQQGFEAHGSDLSRDAVATVNEQLMKIGYPHLVKHECMTSFSAAAESFQGVMAYNVIYHAYRSDLEATIRKVWDMLEPDGLFFSTFLPIPDGQFSSKVIAPNTIVKEGGEEDGIPHHFISREELPNLLSGFELVQVWERIWEYDHFTKKSRHLCVIARKKSPTSLQVGP